MRRLIVLTILIILMSHVTQAQDLHRFEIGISGGGPDWMLGYVGGAESHFSLIGSLCDLTSGSGDKGTPVVLVQGYFDNYTSE